MKGFLIKYLLPLLPMLGKFGADLFGNKTRSSLTTGGAVLVSLLVAMGVKPELADNISRVMQCAAVEAVQYHEEATAAELQGESTAGVQHAGDSGGIAGVFEPGGHDHRSGVYGGGSGEVGGYHRQGESVGRTLAPPGRLTHGGSQQEGQPVNFWRWPDPPPVAA